MRAVVDTNVWISAFISPHGHPARVLGALLDGKFQAVFAQAVLDEVHDVLHRPRIATKYRLQPGAITAYVTGLEALGEVVPVTGDVRVSRDPKDDMLVEAAVLGRAAAIVSGDGDVRLDPAVTSYLAERGIQALSAREFLVRLQGT